MMNAGTPLAVVEPVDPVLLTLLGVDAALAIGVLITYSLFANWWSTKTGVGVFALYWTVGLIIFHFAAEATWGQGPDWREIALLILLGCVLIWNGALIVYKQVVRRRAEAGARP